MCSGVSGMALAPALTLPTWDSCLPSPPPLPGPRPQAEKPSPSHHPSQC